MTSPPSNAAGAGLPWKRIVLGALVLLGLWFLGRPLAFLALAGMSQEDVVVVVPEGHGNDASGLEQAALLETWPVPEETEAAIAGLRALLQRARSEGLPVSIAGSMHSMGGHTIAPGGIRLDMRTFRSMEVDEEQLILTVGSGAIWSDILEFLDPLGLSVAIMQSNDSFTVGGSLSVNCHGWQHGEAPISSSVLSFRLLLANGELRECSRESNLELFSMALGGYGLFGVLLDVNLRLVPNELYRTEAQVIAADELGEEFLRRARDPAVGLAAGRISIAPDDFLHSAVLSVLTRAEPQGELPALEDLANRGLRRTVFRASVGSDYGKGLRWWLESASARYGAETFTTRNTELAEGVEVYGNHDPKGTDILHEYFIPHAALGAFLDGARPIFEGSDCDLLNITVRDVREDQGTFLRYADQGMFGLVMLFHQARTPEAEVAMQRLTRDLIDLALSLEGRHYLPYRLHASRAQFEAGYPMGRDFFEAKRRYDPDEIFQNQFYRAYGLRDSGPNPR